MCTPARRRNRIWQKEKDKSETRVKIPAPKFVVFYNGSENLDDWSQQSLSSAYEQPVENPDLELRVTVLNVNEGHNTELMEHCQTLKEYAQYVARVRKYTSTTELSLEEAVECAVNECIKEGILSEFLTQNRAEVISMSIFEYDKEEEEKKLRKAEYDAGVEAGMKAQMKSQIKKKLEKGKLPEEIAEDLEEEIAFIQKLIDELKEA